MKKQVECIEFQCQYCGKKFFRLRRHVIAAQNKNRPIKYCSRDCANHGRDTRVEIKCCVCGKPFLIQGRLYFQGIQRTCSAECARRKSVKNNEKIELECKNCHQKFFVTRSYYKKQTKRDQNLSYCSLKCRKEAQQKNSVEVVCKVCDKKFLINRDKVSLNGNCCSLKCKQEFFKKCRHEVICNFCGKAFTVLDSTFKTRETKIFYCCQECRLNSIRKTKNQYRQLAHYLRSTDQYKKWRLEVLKASKYTCAICGTRNNIHVHHIKPLFDITREYNFSIKDILGSDIFNNPNNGKVLCIDCHHKEHPYLCKDKINGRFMPLQDKNEVSLAIIKAELSGEAKL